MHFTARGSGLLLLAFLTLLHLFGRGSALLIGSGIILIICCFLTLPAFSKLSEPCATPQASKAKRYFLTMVTSLSDISPEFKRKVPGGQRRAHSCPK